MLKKQEKLIVYQMYLKIVNVNSLDDNFKSNFIVCYDLDERERKPVVSPTRAKQRVLAEAD